VASPIPILNLYYLLSYAWERYQAGEWCDVEADTCPDLENLFAVMLAGGLSQLARHGVDRAYVLHEEETARLRGRLMLMQSLRRQTHLAGRMHCAFDELSADVLHNQLLHSVAAKLLGTPVLTRENRQRLRHAMEPLKSVQRIRVTSALFRRVQLHRNNRIYRFLLNLCALIHRMMLPGEPGGGSHRVEDVLRDEKFMHQLFERFVRNFAARHCPEASVSSKALHWQASGDEIALAHLPGMITDVTVEWPSRKLIADCKYYASSMTERHETLRLHSSHLYQLLAYLKNQAVHPGWETVEGLLIYPAVQRHFDLSYTLLGHKVRAATLDLSQPWQALRQSLIGLLGCETEAVG
jgi:5-methylcytosine-specific restriction enzyme subunit McrC